MMDAPEWTQRLPDPFDGIQPPVAALIVSGTRAQAWRAGFRAGALDSLRQAWRVSCPSCRQLLTPIAAMYQREVA
jgi:hypothetical protein